LNKDQVVAYLKSLSEMEAIEVFYKVFEPKVVHGENFVDDIYCISQSSYMYDGSLPYTEFVGLPKNGLNNLSKRVVEAGPVESGTCRKCKTLVTGVSKIVVCPICNSDVECT
jgi:hypothetical protein